MLNYQRVSLQRPRPMTLEGTPPQAVYQDTSSSRRTSKRCLKFTSCLANSAMERRTKKGATAKGQQLVTIMMKSIIAYRCL